MTSRSARRARTVTWSVEYFCGFDSRLTRSRSNRCESAFSIGTSLATSTFTRSTESEPVRPSFKRFSIAARSKTERSSFTFTYSRAITSWRRFSG
jgi:hypothetical protein